MAPLEAPNNNPHEEESAMEVQDTAVESGFIKRLFDLSFKEFITIKIIKVLYILAIIGAGIWALVVLFGGFAGRSFGSFLGGLVLAPVVFLLSVTFSRIWLETLIVLFRIAENTSRMAGSSTATTPKTEG